MHMGNDNPIRSYVLNGVEIRAEDEERDLGVYLTSDCKPKAAGKVMQSLMQNYQEDLVIKNCQI